MLFKNELKFYFIKNKCTTGQFQNREKYNATHENTLMLEWILNNFSNDK